MSAINMKLYMPQGLLVGAVLAWSANAHAVEIERPHIELVDKFKVNMATGQVTHSMETVGIGGPLGLRHSASVYANELNFHNNFGFADKYWQESRSIRLSTNAANPIPLVYHVADSDGSADFMVYVSGIQVREFGGVAPPYTYVPVADERQSLVTNNDELVWTKPDGAIVKFQRLANAVADASGNLKEITYPNGLVVTVAWAGLQSVNSSSGFQLKYLYVADNRPMAKPDIPQLANTPPLATASQSGFASRNPRFIQAVNNAFEYCAPAAVTCTFTSLWPTATFDWPAGMPRVMFIGDNQATITNSVGALAKFDIRAYDLNVGYPTPPGPPPGIWNSPRVIGVTPFGATSPQYTYDFINLYNYAFSEYSFVGRVKDAGIVTGATNISRTSGRSFLVPYSDGAYSNSETSGGINFVLQSPGSVPGNTELASYADTEDGRVLFEASARNFPTEFDNLSGPWERYEYSRANLSKISVLINSAWEVRTQASFPASCTLATQKTCNQPDWIQDANGNKTNYAYHASSGYVASITYPANKRGVVAQTRYEYTQLSAHYFNGGASKITGPPIWMKTAERSCINSNYSAGVCTGADEVVTRYEYNNDNLLMTGVTVTDPATGAVHRSCFEYDRFGNQIGATQPNANLSACP